MDNTYPRRETIDGQCFSISGTRKTETQINGIKMTEYAADGSVLIDVGRSSVKFYALNYDKIEQIAHIEGVDAAAALRERMEQIFGVAERQR